MTSRIPFVQCAQAQWGEFSPIWVWYRCRWRELGVGGAVTLETLRFEPSTPAGRLHGGVVVHRRREVG